MALFSSREELSRLLESDPEIKDRALRAFVRTYNSEMRDKARHASAARGGPCVPVPGERVSIPASRERGPHEIDSGPAVIWWTWGDMRALGVYAEAVAAVQTEAAWIAATLPNVDPDHSHYKWGGAPECLAWVEGAKLAVHPSTCQCLGTGWVEARRLSRHPSAWVMNHPSVPGVGTPCDGGGHWPADPRPYQPEGGA